MYCPNCGKELENQSNFCSGCGRQISGTGTPVQSQEEQEIVMKQGLCNRVKNVLYVENGQGILTNKRFIYARHNVAKMLILGPLVTLTPKDYKFSIPISDILELREGRQGISKTIIICTKYDKEFNFYFTERKSWQFEFERLMSGHRS